ncbi:hypothetical protein MKEN_01308100 [Mycena kentingensis (nom. inval.)]|nr:hypothetical protein MKEN_01308100 [Mycena kentingensis (nom. inval.)]
MARSLSLIAIVALFALATSAQSTPNTVPSLLRRQSDDTVPAVCQKPCTGTNGCGDDNSSTLDPSACCDANNNNILANCANCLVSQGSVSLSVAQTNYEAFLEGCNLLGKSLKNNTITGSFKAGAAGGNKPLAGAGIAALGLGLGCGMLL